MAVEHAYFLVDADRKVGSGHFTRCIVLAGKLMESGISSTFVTCSEAETFIGAVTSGGFGLKRIQPADAANPEALIQLIDSDICKRSIVVVDSFRSEYFTGEYQRRVKESGAKLMMFTFRNDCHFYADVVLNQNITGIGQKYSAEPESRMLLGPEFAILRDDFHLLAERKENRAGKVNTLLISFGGSDMHDLSFQAAGAVEGIEVLVKKIVIVLGPMYRKHEELKSHIEKKSHLNVEVHSNTSNMPQIMAGCDMAVTSGGITVWELGCLGVPNIIISTTDIERQTASYLHRKELCYHLGHFEDVGAADMSREVSRLASDTDRRVRFSRRMRRFLDGRGAERVAEVIREL